jgi:hypothetical protein
MSFGCALASKIVSEQTGPVSCIVSRNVYGSDGRVLLIERGAHLDGAYHAQVRVGQSRIAVLWERLRMPNGVVVDLASPATGALGEAGRGRRVDNHWPERIGAALFLSFIDDAVKIEIAREQAKGNAAATVLLQGSGSDTSTLAGKVLDSTLNIAPTDRQEPGRDPRGQCRPGRRFFHRVRTARGRALGARSEPNIRTGSCACQTKTCSGRGRTSTPRTCASPSSCVRCGRCWTGTR